MIMAPEGQAKGFEKSGRLKIQSIVPQDGGWNTDCHIGLASIQER